MSLSGHGTNPKNACMKAISSSKYQGIMLQGSIVNTGKDIDCHVKDTDPPNKKCEYDMT
jgi:hypothetical protein